MMKQKSLTTVCFELAPERTRKREFLHEMNLVVPWSELVGRIQPYASAGTTGRPPFAVEALPDVPLYCQFALLDPGMSRLPDESTMLRFRHLLEEHYLSRQIVAAINVTLANNGLMLKAGTVVDATLVAALSSTKNKDGERDPEMHQAKKGSHWHFWMKAHIGVDVDSSLMHSVIGTAADVNDVTQGHDLLHGKEKVVFADAGLAALLEQAEKLKVSERTRVEHPFRMIKRQFGRVKVRYRYLAKYTAQLIRLYGLSNLRMVRKRILQDLQA